MAVQLQVLKGVGLNAKQEVVKRDKAYIADFIYGLHDVVNVFG